jgi:acyl carrier protein
MPIPDPDKIWPKLDEVGIDEVCRRLSMGVYADYKIPVIEEWLRRHDNYKNQSGEKPNRSKAITIPEQKSKYDRFIHTCKNHPVVVIILILVMLVVGLGAVTDAITKISSFSTRLLSSPEPRNTENSVPVVTKHPPAEHIMVELPPVLPSEDLVDKRKIDIAQVENTVRALTSLVYDVKLSSVSIETRFDEIENPNELIPGIRVVELIIKLETAYECKIDDEIAERIHTVNDAIMTVLSCK